MQKTETTQAFTVTVDPTYARSIVANYSDYEAAFTRFQNEWLRIKFNGGSVRLYDAAGLQMENNTRGIA